MADPDLTRRLRQWADELTPGRVIGADDLYAAADRIDQLEQQLADLHTQRREHDKVVAWADDALARRDARIADLLAERDEARAALADLHTAIGDPEWLEWWTGALADIPETLKIRLERIRAAVEHTQEGAGG